MKTSCEPPWRLVWILTCHHSPRKTLSVTVCKLLSCWPGESRAAAKSLTKEQLERRYGNDAKWLPAPCWCLAAVVSTAGYAS